MILLATDHFIEAERTKNTFFAKAFYSADARLQLVKPTSNRLFEHRQESTLFSSATCWRRKQSSVRFWMYSLACARFLVWCWEEADHVSGTNDILEGLPYFWHEACLSQKCGTEKLEHGFEIGRGCLCICVVSTSPTSVQSRARRQGTCRGTSETVTNTGSKDETIPTLSKIRDRASFHMKSATAPPRRY